MPCFHCGTRQTDPEGGSSPWRRAVRAGRQVLVCPDCQDDGEWERDVDACASCGSPALARRLGQTVCTRCLTLLHDGVTSIADSPADDQLARDVAAAIDRVLGYASTRN